MMDKKEVVSFRCDPELNREIRKLAARLNLPISYVISDIILENAYAWSKRYQEKKQAASIELINNETLVNK